MGMILGVLEHLIFKLNEKQIKFELKILNPPEMKDPTILLQLEQDRYIYIIQKKERVSYYLRKARNKKRKSISKGYLLKYIETL
jgi:hypothetical protein